MLINNYGQLKLQLSWRKTSEVRQQYEITEALESIPKVLSTQNS